MKSRLDTEFLEQSSEVLRAVAHPIRLAIIDLLYQNKELTVTQIYGALQIEQAIASHHLRILKDKKVVESKRHGKNSFYALRSHAYYRILQSLEVQTA